MALFNTVITNFKEKSYILTAVLTNMALAHFSLLFILIYTVNMKIL